MKTKRSEYIRVEHLTTSFKLPHGRRLVAVDDLSFNIYHGEILGVVGESGSGKSVMAKSLLQLVPPPGTIDSGKVFLNGVDILTYSDKEMRSNIRGTEISMIFQEPMSALNPSFSVKWQIEEVLRLHTTLNKQERYERVLDLLRKVSIPDPEKRMKEYPHQFSGGMQQRVLIAIALASSPRLLIADEPTTALDVTVQADIMDFLEGMRQNDGPSILLISHNLNLVTERSDRIMVMYAGRIMEMATSIDLVNNPLHPYTIGLMDSVPDLGKEGQKLTAIPGELPNLAELGNGCVFYSRCSKAMPICEKTKPEPVKVGTEHYCSCHLHQVVPDGGR
jgi:oligopeptide/dipeptide ABC transporter ATP-binding protein